MADERSIRQLSCYFFGLSDDLEVRLYPSGTCCWIVLFGRIAQTGDQSLESFS
jgi:hypothetical protein